MSSIDDFIPVYSFTEGPGLLDQPRQFVRLSRDLPPRTPQDLWNRFHDLGFEVPRDVSVFYLEYNGEKVLFDVRGRGYRIDGGVDR